METPTSGLAVLALHWVNDIVMVDGAFGDIFAPMVESSGVVERTASVLEAARTAGTPVIYTRICFRPGYPDLIQNTSLLTAVFERNALVDGSKGAEIIAALTPQPQDIVVDHQRMTAFYGTELDTILRNLGVTTLALTGVATNVTVEGTARDGINAGYRVIVLSDCCSAATSESHAASLDTMGMIGEVATGAEFIATMSSTAVSSPAASVPDVATRNET